MWPEFCTLKMQMKVIRTTLIPIGLLLLFSWSNLQFDFLFSQMDSEVELNDFEEEERKEKEEDKKEKEKELLFISLNEPFKLISNRVNFTFYLLYESSLIKEVIAPPPEQFS